MARRDDEELMAFLDGELPPRDAREVEARIDASAETRQKVEALEEMSELVRTHYERETEAAEPGMAAAWARLEAQLGAEPPVPAASTRAEAARASEGGGFWQSIVDVFRPRFGYVLTGAIGVAAGALLVTALRPITIQIVGVREPVPVPIVDGAQPEVVAAAAEETEVDDLDVQSGTGMVFQVPGQNAEKPATTVIWVTDDAPTEGPI